MDITTTIDAYMAFWNEPDAERRGPLLAQAFSEDARYQGPLLEATGRDGIAALASQLREHLGDHRFERTGQIDAHHDVVRYAWQIVPVSGEPHFAAGVDIGTLDASGRLKSVTAFLDVAPEGLANHHDGA